MPKRTTSYTDDLRGRLRDDPEQALAYLKATFEDEEDDGEAGFFMALRDIARSQNKSYVVESGTGRPSLKSVQEDAAEALRQIEGKLDESEYESRGVKW